MPQELSYLWSWYLRAQGFQPLTWSEIESWTRLTATQITPVEAEALMKLDEIYRSIR